MKKKIKVLLIEKLVNPYDKKNLNRQLALPGDLIRLEEDMTRPLNVFYIA